ncbi:lactate dehydrogenase [Cupriavidus sp. USMAHM13]|uniref:Ldh family oxidoreductase n=1 Tax=Cupriavidus sp. USMAHM13 TaxID=1389192 RepID=UPI0008A67329|nr:Ldh family oxidoreductase [Cupriavidus sp. USMAHM13]AOZ03370.1 lactate dehydrogenase [Cupriavidus sp. USMAHM13]
MKEETQTVRHDSAALVELAGSLLRSAGMPGDRADDVAAILVEADLMGHDTHGLQLLPTYLAEIESGSMAVQGDYTVLSERAAVATWDGHRLPGPWLTLRALDAAMARARDYGTGTVTIRRSHHIACLAAYLERATQAGYVMLLFSSAPAAATVAPFGGTRAVFSPSPLAVGFPTPRGPVLIDVSTSITTNGLTGRLYREGKRLPHPWLIDAQGRLSDDPAVLFAPQAGSILPLGGLDAGHKGFALSLMVEALTAGLSGHGRDDPGKRWGNTVFLQVLDPEAFAGGEAFAHQMGWVAGACADNPPRPGVDAVRLPGQGALARKARQLRDGVALNPAIVPQLAPWLEKYGVAMPAPVAG